MTGKTAAEASRQIREINTITRMWGAQTGVYDVVLADRQKIRLHAAPEAADELRIMGYELTSSPTEPTTPSPAGCSASTRTDPEHNELREG